MITTKISSRGVTTIKGMAASIHPDGIHNRALDIDSARSAYYLLKNERLSNDTKFKILNVMLGAYGVEVLRAYNDKALYLYLNFGDAYDCTVILDLERNCWIIAPWGDIAERDKRIF